MKYFLCFVIFAVAFVAAKPAQNKNTAPVVPVEVEADKIETPVAESDDNTRFRKAAYGGHPKVGPVSSHVPSPPCPTNYLFSCSPNLAPVPCAVGSAAPYGAYSAPIPAYLPQEFEGQFYQY